MRFLFSSIVTMITCSQADPDTTLAEKAPELIWVLAHAVHVIHDARELSGCVALFLSERIPFPTVGATHLSTCQSKMQATAMS